MPKRSPNLCVYSHRHMYGNAVQRLWSNLPLEHLEPFECLTNDELFWECTSSPPPAHTYLPGLSLSHLVHRALPSLWAGWCGHVLAPVRRGGFHFTSNRSQWEQSLLAQIQVHYLAFAKYFTTIDSICPECRLLDFDVWLHILHRNWILSHKD